MTWLQQSRHIELMDNRGAIKGCRQMVQCSENLCEVDMEVDMGVGVITGRGNKVLGAEGGRERK